MHLPLSIAVGRLLSNFVNSPGRGWASINLCGCHNSLHISCSLCCRCCHSRQLWAIKMETSSRRQLSRSSMKFVVFFVLFLFSDKQAFSFCFFFLFFSLAAATTHTHSHTHTYGGSANCCTHLRSQRLTAYTASSNICVDFHQFVAASIATIAIRKYNEQINNIITITIIICIISLTIVQIKATTRVFNCFLGKMPSSDTYL